MRQTLRKKLGRPRNEQAINDDYDNLNSENESDQSYEYTTENSITKHSNSTFEEIFVNNDSLSPHYSVCMEIYKSKLSSVSYESSMVNFQLFDNSRLLGSQDASCEDYCNEDISITISDEDINWVSQCLIGVNTDDQKIKRNNDRLFEFLGFSEPLPHLVCRRAPICFSICHRYIHALRDTARGRIHTFFEIRHCGFVEKN